MCNTFTRVKVRNFHGIDIIHNNIDLLPITFTWHRLNGMIIAVAVPYSRFPSQRPMLHDWVSGPCLLIMTLPSTTRLFHAAPRRNSTSSCQYKFEMSSLIVATFDTVSCSRS